MALRIGWLAETMCVDVFRRLGYGEVVEDAALQLFGEMLEVGLRGWSVPCCWRG